MDFLHDISLKVIREKAEEVQSKGSNAKGYNAAFRALKYGTGGFKAIAHFWPDVTFIACSKSEADRFFELQQAGELEEVAPKKRIIKKKL